MPWQAQRLKGQLGKVRSEPGYYRILEHPASLDRWLCFRPASGPTNVPVRATLTVLSETPFLLNKHTRVVCVPLHRAWVHIVLPRDWLCICPSLHSLSRAEGPQAGTQSRHHLHAAWRSGLAIRQAACPSTTCGLALSTPTLPESPGVYHSRLMWTREPSRHVLRVFSLAHPELVPNGGSPSEMTCVTEDDWTFK